MTAIRSIARTTTGGCTVDAEVDPNRTSDETFTNPYAGYGSVLFNNIYLQQVVWTDSSGTELSLRTVAAAMRNVQATLTASPCTRSHPKELRISSLTNGSKMAETG